MDRDNKDFHPITSCDMLLIPKEQRRLVNYDDAKDLLRDKFALICPDANVLRYMVALGKYHVANDSSNHLKRLSHCLSNIEQWLSQIETCEKLININEVGWIIPEQILREVDKCRNKISNLKNYKNNLKNAEKSPHPELQKATCDMIEKFDKLIKKATEIRTHIVKNLLILEEKSKHVNSAWELLYNGHFPNIEAQQMKDSVILCHLLDFRTYMKKPLFFWTFDRFNSPENSKLFSFPSNLSEYTIDVSHDIRHALPNIEKEVHANKKSFEESMQPT